MNKIIHLSITKKDVPIRMDVVQYATEPSIVFVLDDYTPSAGSVANLYIKKPDGTEIYNSCTISGNQVTYRPTTQSFAALGVSKCQLQIVKSGNTAVSFLIYADVTENIIDSSAVESQDEFTALEEALSTVSDYDGRITTNANNISALTTRMTTAETTLAKVDGIERGAIAAGADLNSITDMGYYNVPANRGLVNAPTTAAGILEVFRTATSSKTVQFYYTHSNNIYFRVWTTSAWTDWQELAKTNDVVKTAGATFVTVGAANTLDPAQRVRLRAKDDTNSKDFYGIFTDTGLLLYDNEQSATTWSMRTVPKQLTITRTENDYCNATSVGRLRAYELGGFLWLNGNFQINTAMPASSGSIEIARISDWNGIYAGDTNAPMQNGSGVILASVSQTGVISLNNAGSTSVSGFGRSQIIVPKA